MREGSPYSVMAGLDLVIPAAPEYARLGASPVPAGAWMSGSSPVTTG
jgi:hypothetical protein